MKHLAFLLFLLLAGSSAFAQIVKPLHWSYKVEKIKADEYKIVFTALIDKPWHTYGMYIPDGGPVRTGFTYDKNADIELIGKMTEAGPKMEEKMDDVFGIKLKTFEEKAIFEQRVKLKKKTTLKCAVEFMACDDKSCLPPDTKKFEIIIE
jgi:thiol:disulfide interchange protein DsbD